MMQAAAAKSSSSSGCGGGCGRGQCISGPSSSRGSSGQYSSSTRHSSVGRVAQYSGGAQNGRCGQYSSDGQHSDGPYGSSGCAGRGDALAPGGQYSSGLGQPSSSNGGGGGSSGGVRGVSSEDALLGQQLGPTQSAEVLEQLRKLYLTNP